MAGGEGRRARKAVNYAEVADFGPDDDFVDFRPSPTAKTERSRDKENVDWQDRGERRHRKERDRDHKSHHRDKDRHRKDRDKDRDRRRRDNKDRDYTRNGDQKYGLDGSYDTQDSGNDVSADSTYSSDTQAMSMGDSEVMSTTAPAPTLTSSIVSPGRRNPKPRLTLEEKIFQRELEAVLELSKGDVNRTSLDTSKPRDNDKTEPEEGGAINETTQDEKTETPPSTRNPNGAGNESSVPVQITERTAEPSLPEELNHEGVDEEVETPDPTPTPPPALPNCKVTKEPLPSTSTGKTAKRIRKTVVFKEDSDSDFDGFGIVGGGDESEESDFMPSPKKKKKKESKKNRNAKAKDKEKHSAKPKEDRTRGVVSSQRNHRTIAKNSATISDVVTPPRPTRTVPSPKITSSPEFKRSPPLKSTTATKITKSPELEAPRTNSPPAKITTPANVAKLDKSPIVQSPTKPQRTSTKPVKKPSTTTIKSPFRNPLTTSPNNSITVPTQVSSRTLYRGTGLRLGLSRSASLKPLHPNVARRISD